MEAARVVVAGGTGFLGTALCNSLAAAGHRVVVLTRKRVTAALDPAQAARPHPGVHLASWTPDGTTGPWKAFLDGAGAVVNLAGESLAARRWTPGTRRRIRDSRLDATRSLVEAIRVCERPPVVFISGSAVGYYGTHSEQVLTESSPAGSDFLAELCLEWEATAAYAARSVQRFVALRTGLVLDREGGALARMTLPFRLFAGGRLGSGRQPISWIHRDDWTGMVRWAIESPSVTGPLNATAPNPVTNIEFAEALGAVLRRPAWLPVPAPALRLLIGEMADALLLGGQRAVPRRALELGFRFRYERVRDALEAVLGRSPSRAGDNTTPGSDRRS
jgi:uncharacterized protein (TIGR01777 family)